MDLINGIKQLVNVILEEWKLILFLTIILCIYFYFTSTFDHFTKRGVQFMKPTIFFGNLWPKLTAQLSFHEFQLLVYNKFKGNPCAGIFEGRIPTLYILDPDLIKAVTIRDFDHFVDRIVMTTKEPRYIQRFLTNLKESEWKRLRKILTPAYSSFRLKKMFPIMQHSSQKFLTYMDNIDLACVEMKQVLGYYSLDITGACAFGINSSTLIDGSSEFVKAAEGINDCSLVKRIVLISLLVLLPDLLPYVNISYLNQDVMVKLRNILKKAKEIRRSSDFRQNDFLQLLIDAGANDAEDSSREMDDDTIDGQSLLFLMAGYESTSTGLMFCIYNLMIYPDIQEKLRAHIEEVTKGEELTFDHLGELDYLDGFIFETLRIHPPFPRIDRVCVKPYVLPGTSIRIEPNERIIIPLIGIHTDPDIYPEPEKFKPERFTREGKKERPAHLYLTFGSGPRHCIAYRFVLTTMKTVLVTLLRNYKISTCPKTEIPMQFDKRTRLVRMKNGLWVNMEKINSK